MTIKHMKRMSMNFFQIYYKQHQRSKAFSKSSASATVSSASAVFIRNSYRKRNTREQLCGCLDETTHCAAHDLIHFCLFEA